MQSRKRPFITERESRLLREGLRLRNALVSASVQAVQAAQSRWCRSGSKRAMDILVSSAALLLFSPLLFAIALGIRVMSGNPVIFRQWRAGRYGREFQLLKFRTMAFENVDGPALTRPGDPRVTSVGKWLRHWKLDELPQLVNVLRGEMSLVGPRPDLSEFWERVPMNAREALKLVPGLTGAASLTFRNEESLLSQVAPEKLALFYVEKLLPRKAQLDLEYASRSTFESDCRILVHTIAATALPSRIGDRTHVFHEYFSQQ
jgi:lipopolysaccharide/colanic/teichoic acid biosynthesis glycosyltransferase